MTDTKSWQNRELHDKATGLLQRAAIDRMIGDMGLAVLNEQAAYDAGFEYGVLATENGLGRADTA